MRDAADPRRPAPGVGRGPRSAGPIRWLDRGEGRIAFEVWGDGPLVVCVPGLGQVRGIYRRTAEALVAGGFRVAAMDLRGHGDSDGGFGSYGDGPSASDLEAVIVELGGPSVVLGNSMGAAAAVLAAARRPELVAGLVLLGPVTRDQPAGPVAAWAQRLLLAGPWAPAVWGAYLATLYPGRRPDDFARQRAFVVWSLRRPGHLRAFRETARTSRSAAEACLADVQAPAVVVMGERDPDFRDPAGEARWLGGRLGAEVRLVPGAGHFPHDEYPEVVGPVVLQFVRAAFGRA